jgi:hypothetical protein
MSNLLGKGWAKIQLGLIMRTHTQPFSSSAVIFGPTFSQNEITGIPMKSIK